MTTDKKRERITTRLREIQEMQYINIPCAWCKGETMHDGPQWIDDQHAVCYDCADEACRS